MSDRRLEVITRRIAVAAKPNATPKPSAIRCAHCGTPMVSERNIRFCSERCRDCADDLMPPALFIRYSAGFLSHANSPTSNDVGLPATAALMILRQD
jgi:hypothetical protein